MFRKLYIFLFFLAASAGAQNSAVDSLLNIIGSKADAGKVCASYLSLSKLYTVSGNYRDAFIAHKSYVALKDSLHQVESDRQMAEMQEKYETAKKDKELIKKDTEIDLQLADAKRKSFQRNVFIVCFGLTIVLSLFIYRSYRLKRLANFKLKKQKEVIEEKQKEILDSIHYARRIQHVLITPEKYIANTLKRLNSN